MVVTPVAPSERLVAATVPRFRAAAESTVRAPALVDQVEAAAPVKVKAPVETTEVVLMVRAAKVADAVNANAKHRTAIMRTFCLLIDFKFIFICL